MNEVVSLFIHYGSNYYPTFIKKLIQEIDSNYDSSLWISNRRGS